MKKLLLILFSIFNTLYPNDYTIIPHENGGTTWIPNTWETKITPENDTILEPYIGISNHLNFQERNIQERKRFLENYTKRYQLDSDVNLEILSRVTSDVPYAEDLVELAVDHAKQRSSKTISRKDFDWAYYSLTTVEKDREPTEVWETAVHEAGHALVCTLLLPKLLYDVTIISQKSLSYSIWETGGCCRTLLSHYENNFDMLRHCSYLMMLLAGAVAEEVILNSSDAKLILSDFDVPSIFIGDISASKLTIKKILHDFGGDGVVTIDKNKKLSSEEESSYTQIILQRHYDKAKELIKNNKDTLIKIAKALVERKTLTEIEVKELVESSKESANKIVQPAPQIQRRKNQVVYAAHAKLKKATVSHKK